jgi:hypothetical protein
MCRHGRSASESWRVALSSFVSALVFVVALAPASAQCPAGPGTAVWATATSGNWTDASRWDPPCYPNDADKSVVVSVDGTYTVTVNTSPTLGDFTLNAIGATVSATSRVITAVGPLGQAVSSVLGGALKLVSSTWAAGSALLVDGGELHLTSSTVSAPTLSVVSGKVFVSGNSGVTGDLDVGAEGGVEIANSGSLSPGGGASVTNDGLIVLKSSASTTELVLQGDVQFSGSGAVRLDNGANNRVRHATAGTLTNAGHTFEGGGQIGVNVSRIVNSGSVVANDSTALQVDPGGATPSVNQGSLRAEGGGTLALLAGVWDNLGGVIEALDGSTVTLSGVDVVGGLLDTAGSGVIQASGAPRVADAELDGLLQVPNAQTLEVEGVFQVDGTVALGSTASTTSLLFFGDVVLTGSGAIAMGPNANNRAVHSGTGTVTLAGPTVQGSGNLGGNISGVVNQGVVEATTAVPLIVDPGALGLVQTASGVLRAVGAGVLRLLAGTYTGGAIRADGTGEVRLEGPEISGAALESVPGTTIRVVSTASVSDVELSGALLVQNAASLTGAGTIDGAGASIQLASTASTTTLSLAPGAQLTGVGAVDMGNHANNRVISSAGVGTATNVGWTVRGSGALGANSLALINQGVVSADQPTSLICDPPPGLPFVNEGELVAALGGTLRLNGGDFENVGGVVRAEDGSAVELAGASVMGGAITSEGTGEVRVVTASTVSDGAAMSALVRVPNASSLTLVAPGPNTGEISLESTVSITELRCMGDCTLTGGGTITLSDKSGNRLLHAGATGLWSIVDQTIQGAGQIGANISEIANAGLIVATGLAELVIDAASTVVNTGELRANAGSTLVVQGSTVVNTAGVLRAADGGTVELSGAIVDGGLLDASDDGEIRIASLSRVRNASATGRIFVPNASALELEGVLELAGVVEIGSSVSITELRVVGDVVLGGGGKIVGSPKTGNRIIAASGAPTLTFADQAFEGAGQIGANTLALHVASPIRATSSVATLTVDPAVGGLMNTSLLEAAPGATLRLLTAEYDNEAGVVRADDGVVDISGGALTGGVVDSTEAGIVELRGAKLTDVVHLGRALVPNAQTATLAGTLSNAATLTVGATVSVTSLLLDGLVSLDGGGVIELSNTAANRIQAIGSGGSLDNQDNVIRGAGNVGANTTSVGNGGGIVADGTAKLTVDPPSAGAFTNDGVLSALGSGGLEIALGPFSNAGLVHVAGGSTLARTGDFPQSGGATRVDGTLSASSGFALDGGELLGRGTVAATVTNSGGVVAPGPDPGALTITGAYTQGLGGALHVELAGDPASGAADKLVVQGAAALDGTLRIALADGYVPSGGETFTVLQASAVTGDFAFVDAPGVFDVTITATQVLVTVISLDSGCDTPCDDADPCTLDLCDSAGCASAPRSCADGDPCTADLCGEDGACTHEDVQCNGVLLTCSEPPGDVNGDDKTDVVDVQCGILVVLWEIVGNTGGIPACLAGPPAAADISCDAATDVIDVQLLISMALGGDLALSIDGDANGCPDLCEDLPL